MRLIVSKSLQSKYRGYEVVSTLNKVLQGINTGKYNIAELEYLILADSDEDAFTTGLNLTMLRKQGVMKILYVTDNPDVTLSMLIKSLECPVVEDVYCFEDEAELDGVIEDAQFGVQLLKKVEDSDIKVLEEFIGAYMRGDNLTTTVAYQNKVKRALQSLNDRLDKANKSLVKVGDESTQIFKIATEIYGKMMKELKRLAENVKLLEQEADSFTENNTQTGVWMFPTHTWVNEKNVLMIKRYNNCPYLVSAMLGYKNYLQGVRNKMVKLVIICSKNDSLIMKYRSQRAGFTYVGDVGRLANYASDKLITDTPNKIFFDTLGKSNAELFIVLDFTCSSTPAMKGARVRQLNAVSGLTDLEVYKLNAGQCVFSRGGTKDALIVLGTVKDYPLDMGRRETVYSTVQEFRNMYQLLDKQTGI